MAFSANNTGGDAIDSADMVRDLRREDRQVSQRSEEAQNQRDGPWEVQESTDRLWRAMDLHP